MSQANQKQTPDSSAEKKVIRLEFGDNVPVVIFLVILMLCITSFMAECGGDKVVKTYIVTPELEVSE